MTTPKRRAMISPLEPFTMKTQPRMTTKGKTIGHSVVFLMVTVWLALHWSDVSAAQPAEMKLARPTPEQAAGRDRELGLSGDNDGQIDRATLDAWSAPYRGWHYHADPIIPSDFKIPGYQKFHSFDVPTVYQLPGQSTKWFMSFIGRVLFGR